MKDEENRGDFHSLGVTQVRRQAWLLGNLATVGGSLFAGRLNCSTPLGLCNILVDHSLSEGDARLTIVHPPEKVGS